MSKTLATDADGARTSDDSKNVDGNAQGSQSPTNPGDTSKDPSKNEAPDESTEKTSNIRTLLPPLDRSAYKQFAPQAIDRTRDTSKDEAPVSEARAPDESTDKTGVAVGPNSGNNTSDDPSKDEAPVQNAQDANETPSNESIVKTVQNKVGAMYDKLTEHLGNDGPAPTWLVHIFGICVIPLGLLIANIVTCTIRSKSKGIGLFNTDIGLFLPCMIAFAALVLATQLICYIFECRVHNALKLAGVYIIVNSIIVGLCIWVVSGLTPEIIIIDANFLWLVLYTMIYTYVYFRNIFHVLWPFGAIASKAAPA